MLTRTFTKCPFCYPPQVGQLRLSWSTDDSKFSQVATMAILLTSSPPPYYLQLFALSFPIVFRPVRRVPFFFFHSRGSVPKISPDWYLLSSSGVKDISCLKPH